MRNEQLAECLELMAYWGDHCRYLEGGEQIMRLSAAALRGAHEPAGAHVWEANPIGNYSCKFCGLTQPMPTIGLCAPERTREP